MFLPRKRPRANPPSRLKTRLDTGFLQSPTAMSPNPITTPKTAQELRAEHEKSLQDSAKRLKSTWEDICHRFGRDFEGEGDEIDLRTGEVIVDNGHLRALEVDEAAEDYLMGKDLFGSTFQPDINERRPQRKRNLNKLEVLEVATDEEEDNAAIASDGNDSYDELMVMSMTQTNPVSRKKKTSPNKAAVEDEASEDELALIVTPSASTRRPRHSALKHNTIHTTEQLDLGAHQNSASPNQKANFMAVTDITTSDGPGTPVEIQDVFREMASNNISLPAVENFPSEDFIMNNFGSHGPALAEYFRKLTQDSNTGTRESSVAVENAAITGNKESEKAVGKADNEETSEVSDDSGIGINKLINSATSSSPALEAHLTNPDRDPSQTPSTRRPSKVRKTPESNSLRDEEVSLDSANRKFNHQGSNLKTAARTPSTPSIWDPLPDDPFWDPAWQDSHPDGEPPEEEFQKRGYLRKQLAEPSSEAFEMPKPNVRKTPRRSSAGFKIPQSAKRNPKVISTPRAKLNPRPKEKDSLTQPTPRTKSFLDFLKKRFSTVKQETWDTSLGFRASSKDSSPEAELIPPAVTESNPKQNDPEAHVLENVEVSIVEDDDLEATDEKRELKRKHDEYDDVTFVSEAQGASVNTATEGLTAEIPKDPDLNLVKDNNPPKVVSLAKCGDIGFRCEKTICLTCIEDWDS